MQPISSPTLPEIDPIAYCRWAVVLDGDIQFISDTRGSIGEQECLLWMLKQVGNSAVASIEAGYRIRPYR